MTAARHKPTRRALPGAAFGAPVLAAPMPGLAEPAKGAGRRHWERALAALREAGASVAAYGARDYLPAHEIHAAIRGRWPVPTTWPPTRASSAPSILGANWGTAT